MSVHVLSVLGGDAVEKEVKQILNISDYMRITFALRVGHSVLRPTEHKRARMRCA